MESVVAVHMTRLTVVAPYESLDVVDEAPRGNREITIRRSASASKEIATCDVSW